MHWLFPHLALGYWSSLLLHSLCVTVDKFTKSLKCKCNVSVSEGFVVLCRSKPSMLSPSKQRPCWPQVSSSAVVFTAMRVNQINFFISIVLAISYSVFAGGYISGMPSQIYGSYPDSDWCEWVCELACLCPSLCKLSLYCLCWLLQQVYGWWWELICFLNPLSLNTLSCGVRLLQDWSAPLNYKPSFHLIGMLFWSTGLIIAVDNTHNITLHYVSSCSYTD